MKHDQFDESFDVDCISFRPESTVLFVISSNSWLVLDFRKDHVLNSLVTLLGSIHHDTGANFITQKEKIYTLTLKTDQDMYCRLISMGGYRTRHQRFSTGGFGHQCCVYFSKCLAASKPCRTLVAVPYNPSRRCDIFLPVCIVPVFVRSR